ncbi:MAG: DUF2207 domain-containing protein [Betaproteobacteria bacterium]|nr:DUF2207 domain-containing protein [Betaproteobacteria bacterium]
MRALLLALLVAALPALAAERVLEFHSDIRIDMEGGLQVTERIVVLAEGRQIQRGILRDFPTDYRDRLGARVKVPFQVVAVSRDGTAEPWRVEPLANGARVRIGNPTVILPRGRHEYEITYRTARQLGFFERHDELYWNVNGNGWTFAMDRISADVQLPAEVPADRIRVEAYTGPQGARGRDYTGEARAGGASFATTRALPARQGLTIVVEFPKGLVREPSFAQRLQWWLNDNKPVLTGVGGIALLLAFLWWRWHLVGRDPRAGPAFPRYEAPPGMGPAEVRFIDRMQYDAKCFAAGLLGLGARGFLRIRDLGSAYELERTGKDVEWLPGERTLAGLLRGPGKPTVIGKAHNPGVQITLETHKRELAQLYEGKLFSRNRGSHGAGIGIAILTVVAMMMQEAPVSAIIVSAALMLIVLVLFARWLPAYSVEGRKLQDRIQGLRQYLGVAEKEDLERMKAPPQTAEEFAKFLPYAVALGVEKTWADRFTATLGLAAVAAAVAGYYGSEAGGGLFRSGGIGDSIGGIADTVSSAATPPGSSSGGSSGGGGGGGGSGGGGGGGGGSGW